MPENKKTYTGPSQEEVDERESAAWQAEIDEIKDPTERKIWQDLKDNEPKRSNRGDYANDNDLTSSSGHHTHSGSPRGKSTRG